MRRSSRVADYMTPSTHFTGIEQSLSIASDRMRRLGIRNLPVVHDGKLCGVLSERDVALAHALPSVELEKLSVGDAMGRDLYPVAESASLPHVVRTMATQGYACAVIMDEGAVVGVFAIGDALRVLGELLDAGASGDAMDPADVRAVVLTEHAHVDALLLRTHRAVHRLLNSRDLGRDTRRVREQAPHLRDAIRSYLGLEERELGPVLSELAGSSGTLGKHLAEEHIRLLADTAAFASALDDTALDPASFAEQLGHLLSNLRRDLEREHALLLNLDAASNDSIITDAAAD